MVSASIRERPMTNRATASRPTARAPIASAPIAVAPSAIAPMDAAESARCLDLSARAVIVIQSVYDSLRT